MLMGVKARRDGEKRPRHPRDYTRSEFEYVLLCARVCRARSLKRRILILGLGKIEFRTLNDLDLFFESLRALFVALHCFFEISIVKNWSDNSPPIV